MCDMRSAYGMIKMVRLFVSLLDVSLPRARLDDHWEKNIDGYKYRVSPSMYVEEKPGFACRISRHLIASLSIARMWNKRRSILIFVNMDPSMRCFWTTSSSSSIEMLDNRAFDLFLSEIGRPFLFDTNKSSKPTASLAIYSRPNSNTSIEILHSFALLSFLIKHI